MKGILVGCDQDQEWMLAWWYRHLRQHHPDLPIAFGDLGMSEGAKQWCQDRGILIPASQISCCSELSLEATGWLYKGKRWVRRDALSVPVKSVWFRKPFLMKQSPFETTLWLDLDCQVLGDLSPLFSVFLGESGLAIRFDPVCYKMVSGDDVMAIRGCNSGVVVFEKQSQLLDSWIELISRAGPAFGGDDPVLAFIICNNYYSLPTIPDRYNWNLCCGPCSEVVVMHWVGERAKTALKLALCYSHELFVCS